MFIQKNYLFKNKTKFNYLFFKCVNKKTILWKINKKFYNNHYMWFKENSKINKKIYLNLHR